MTIANNARYTAVKRGITQVFRNRALAATPYYPHICTLTSSESFDEAYAMVGDSPGMREWIGDRVFHQLRSAELTLANRDFESSLGIRRFDIDDDRLGMLTNRIMELADEAAYHPDELMFLVMNLGEAAPCWDGQNFYDTDHQWGKSGVQSNILTYPVADLANIKPLDVNGAVHSAVTRMQSLKRDNGKYYIRPRVNPMGEMTVNVPLALDLAAKRAFQTEVRDTQGNLMEVRSAQQENIVTPQVDTIQYLGADDGGSDTSMYVHHLGGLMKPFIFQGRKALTQQVKGGDDIEFKDVKHMTEARYAGGYLAWWASVKVKFTQA